MSHNYKSWDKIRQYARLSQSPSFDDYDKNLEILILSQYWAIDDHDFWLQIVAFAVQAAVIGDCFDLAEVY